MFQKEDLYVSPSVFQPRSLAADSHVIPSSYLVFLGGILCELLPLKKSGPFRGHFDLQLPGEVVALMISVCSCKVEDGLFMQPAAQPTHCAS